MRRFLWIIIVAVILAVLFFIIIFNSRNSKVNVTDSAGKVSALSMSTLLNQVKDLEAKGELVQAKNTYQQLIDNFPGSGEMPAWQKRLEDINVKLLFSPTITANSVLYEIKPGDSLTKIAKEFKTTVDLIQRSNNITADKIFPGRKIKVWTVPFSIFVDKSQNRLMLKSGEEVIKTYIVSTGTNNSSPVGTFKIINKLVNPTWFKSGAVVPSDSPDNVLGSRWMGFELAGYGIHGTTEPQNLGMQVTKGCVRMANAEVEELYSIVPVGTEVTIVD